MLQRKITLLLPTFQGSHDKFKHLFFILTDPCFDYESCREDMMLLVNCSSIMEDKPYDSTCILNEGDHPFIKHKSYIYYRQARIEHLRDIEAGIRANRFTTHQIADDVLYERILRGIFVSQYIEPRYQRFTRNAIQQQACLNIFA